MKRRGRKIDLGALQLILIEKLPKTLPSSLSKALPDLQGQLSFNFELREEDKAL